MQYGMRYACTLLRLLCSLHVLDVDMILCTFVSVLFPSIFSYNVLMYQEGRAVV